MRMGSGFCADLLILSRKELALKIAETINIFCDVIGDDSDKCNPNDMKPKDIYNLTVICDHLINSQKSVDK